MYVLKTCKNEEDRVKNKGASGHNISPIISLWGFSRRSRAANSAVWDRIWLKFETSVMLWLSLICKNEEDRIKSEGARVATIFSQL